MPNRDYIDIRKEVHAHRIQLQQKAHEEFGKIVTHLMSPLSGRHLHRQEDWLWPRLLDLGCILLNLWFTRQLPNSTKRIVRRGNCRYKYKELSDTAPVKTIFGEFSPIRRLYKLTSGIGPKTLSPDDRAIGLSGGRMSLRLHLQVGYLCAQMAFARALAVLEKFGMYCPCQKSALGIVDTLGQSARCFLDDLPAPNDDGELLFVFVDCKGAPMLTADEHMKRCKPHKKRAKPTRRAKGARKRGKGQKQYAIRSKQRERRKIRRRKKGDKSKNAMMAAVAVVFTLRRLPNGDLEGPINKRVLGSFGGLAALRPRLQKELDNRGYGRKKTIFLADGERSLWTMQQELFPDAIPCLDWYHLCEYLWDAAGAAFKEGSKELVAWVEQRKSELRKHDIDQVMEELDELWQNAESKRSQKRIEDTMTYIVNHLDQIRYKELLKDNLDIATGPVEGAVKNVIGFRLDGQGMRWAPERAEHVLALRLVLVNELWENFEETTMKRHERLKNWDIPRITPMRTRKLERPVLDKLAG